MGNVVIWGCCRVVWVTFGMVAHTTLGRTFSWYDPSNFHSLLGRSLSTCCGLCLENYLAISVCIVELSYLVRGASRF